MVKKMIQLDPDACFLCQKPDQGCNRCPKCSMVHCGTDHLAVHRGSSKKHPEICWPFRIGRRDVVGNVMVASRDIKAGETILEEKPAVWGPNNKSVPLCLDCLQPVKFVEKTIEKVEEEGTIPVTKKVVNSFCSKCGFPVCNEKCKWVNF